MAEEVVVRDALWDMQIAAGTLLTKELADSGWPLDASLWLYTSDYGAWKLFLASPEVAKQGPRKAYETVQQAISRLPESGRGIQLEDVVVVPPDHPVVRALRTAVRPGQAINGVRYTRTVFDGHYIEDSYVYHVK